MSKTRDRFPRLHLCLDDLQCPRPFMANFFRIMGNYKTSVLMSMQTDAQWDSVDTSMKEIIRKLLNFQMDYRPETEEEAKRIALLIKQYDPMGMMFPYETNSHAVADSTSTSLTQSKAHSDGRSTTRARTATKGTHTSASETEGESDSKSERNGTRSNAGESFAPRFNAELGTYEVQPMPTLSTGSGDSFDSGMAHADQRSRGLVEGESATVGTADGEGESAVDTETEASGEIHGKAVTDTVTTQMHIVSSQEQHFLRVQQLLDGTLMKRHQALVLSEDRSGRRTARLVTMDRFPSAPEYRKGRAVLAQYRSAVRRFTKREERVAYTRVSLTKPKPPKTTGDPKAAKPQAPKQKPIARTLPESLED